MSVKTNFKSVAGKIVETFKPKGGLKEMNIIKANERIAELEKQVETPQAKQTFNVSTEMGASNQFAQDGDVVAYSKNLAAIKERIEPMFEQPKNDRFTFTNGMQSFPEEQVPFVKPEKSKYKAEDFRFVEVDRATYKRNVSTVPPVYLVKQGYYLLLDGGKVYILKDGKNAQKNIRTNKVECVPNILMKSGDPETSGLKRNAGNIVIGNDPHGKWLHLTKQEYDNILKAQPSYEDLMAVYFLHANKERLEMNVSNALPVW
jgi:hypothetical protein